jgi:hypothetical protein
MASRNSNLITHTIPNLIAGVSQQFTEARFETQVEEMENCVPSIARGVIRRNPVTAISSSYTSIPDTAFTYSYDRGTGTEQYNIEIPGDGKWYVHNVNTGDLISSGYRSYFTLPAGAVAKDSFKAVTIGDYTFIVNSTKTVEMKPISSAQSGANLDALQKKMVYWIKKTAAVQISSKAYTTNTVNSNNVVTKSTSSTGIRLEGYRYTLKYPGFEATVQGVKDNRKDVTQYDRITAREIAVEIASKSSKLTADDSFVYATNANYAWEYDDTFGKEASLLIHKSVTSAAELPSTMPISFDKIVKVAGAFDSEYDDYYMKYDASNKSWSECVAPNIATDINPATMPYVIVRKSLSEFICAPYNEGSLIAAGLNASDVEGVGWKPRVAGDEVTIENPSFVGKTISNIFFHKNRLGFLTKDSITLSETGNYGNFFGTTVQSLPDDDPIDLIVATTDVTVLRDAVSTAGVLILFSDDSQFTLTSSGGPLTPASASINTASNYTYNSNAKAIANKVYFISESGGYSQLFAYRLSEGLQSTEAEHLTAHIPSYLPKNVTQVVGHSTLGYVFMANREEPKNLYVLTTTTKSGQDVQNSFHKWSFDFNIIHIDIINNELIILGENGGTTLYSMSLEVPGDISSTEYLDNGDTAYTSSIVLSKFHVKDGKGNGTNRGRTQLRTIMFTTKDNSRYMCSISNNNLSTNPDTSDWMIKSGFWDDNGEWVDANSWKDAYPLYIRNYYDDEKVSVLSKADSVKIEFKNNDKEPSTGFELSTVDIEALFFQRATRI